MKIIDDIFRIRRAKLLGRLQEEYNQISSKPYKGPDDYKRLKELAGKISALKEKNLIVSEKGKKQTTKITETNNKIIGVQNQMQFGKNTKPKK